MSKKNKKATTFHNAVRKYSKRLGISLLVLSITTLIVPVVWALIGQSQGGGMVLGFVLIPLIPMQLLTICLMGLGIWFYRLKERSLDSIKRKSTMSIILMIVYILLCEPFLLLAILSPMNTGPSTNQASSNTTNILMVGIIYLLIQIVCTVLSIVYSIILRKRCNRGGL